MLIRPASVPDIPAALALIESAYRGDSAKRGWTHEADLLGGQRTDVGALTEVIEDPAQTLLLAEHGGGLGGCVAVRDKGPRDDGSDGIARIGYLGLLTVSPDLQAQGMGRRLVAAAEAHAHAFGASIMEMTVIKRRAELVDWYRRRGYHNTGREEPFPLDDPRFGLPKTRDLVFVVLAKRLS